MPQFVELVHLTMVYHFHDMIDMLINCGYEKGTTLFGYGYDFRQSNRYFPICGLMFIGIINKRTSLSCKHKIL